MSQGWHFPGAGFGQAGWAFRRPQHAPRPDPSGRSGTRLGHPAVAVSRCRSRLLERAVAGVCPRQDTAWRHGPGRRLDPAGDLLPEGHQLPHTFLDLHPPSAARATRPRARRSPSRDARGGLRQGRRARPGRGHPAGQPRCDPAPLALRLTTMDLTELLRQVVAEQYQRVVRGRLAHVHQIRRPVLARLEQRLELVQHQRAPPRAGPRLRHDPGRVRRADGRRLVDWPAARRPPGDAVHRQHTHLPHVADEAAAPIRWSQPGRRQARSGAPVAARAPPPGLG